MFCRKMLAESPTDVIVEIWIKIDDTDGKLGYSRNRNLLYKRLTKNGNCYIIILGEFWGIQKNDMKWRKI